MNIVIIGRGNVGSGHGLAPGAIVNAALGAFAL